MMWKCTKCGYELESDECEECPMCGSNMVRSYDDDYNEWDGIY